VHFCIDMFKCKIYCLIHKLVTFTKAMIHLKRHDDLVQGNICRELMRRSRH
jgi:hypothetical protein